MPCVPRPRDRSGFVVFALGSGPAAAQNVLVNPGFAARPRRVDGEPGVSAAWSSLDIAGSAASGSALVANSASVAGFSGGLTQCVAVVPGVTYAFRVRFRVPSGQASTARVQAALDYFSGPSCDGSDGRGIRKRHRGRSRPVSTPGPTSPSARASSPRAWRALSSAVRLAKVAAGGIVQAYFDEPSLAPRRDADDSRLGVDPRAERDVLSDGSLGSRLLAALRRDGHRAPPLFRFPDLRRDEPSPSRSIPASPCISPTRSSRCSAIPARPARSS